MKLFNLIGAAIVLSLTTTACNNNTVTEELESFPVTSPVVIDTNTYTDYVAEITAVQNIEIRAKAQGFLEKVHVDEGSRVAAGQILFSINSREYSENVSKSTALRKMAEAEAKSVELELQNIRSLMDKNIVSKMELEFAKNKLQVAKAKVDEAKANEEHSRLLLSYTEIRAPFSGTINRIPHKIGSLVEEGTLLTSLSQNDEVFAYFDISEKDYFNFVDRIKNLKRDERKVKLVLANSKVFDQEGIIETMDGEFDERTGNLAVRARFSNPNNLLKHGASGKIRIDQQLKQAVIIPQKSTFEIQDRLYVYKVDKTGKIKSQQIKIATRIPHFYIIESGITVKDKIIYEGIQSAKDGEQIKPDYVKMSKIIMDLSKFN